MILEQTSQKTRYAWIDIARAFSIFAIYLGHYEEAAGLLWPFVYTFHVPLFFMISGFFAVPDKQLSFRTFICKKFKGLACSYLLFSAITLIVLLVTGKKPLEETGKLIFLSFLAIKNKTPALGVWFLPCLFIISIVFESLRRLIKNQYVIMGIAMILFLIEERFLPYHPYQYPIIPWGVDTAMYYMIFYAVGAWAYPYIKSFSFHTLKKSYKVLFICITSIAFLYWMAVLFVLDKPVFEFLIPLKLSVFYQLFLAFLGGYMVIFISKLIAGHMKAQTLCRLGKNTLMLCGNESTIKALVPWILSFAGISYAPKNTLECILYIAFLYLIAHLTLIPLERKLFPSILK